jgi:hypothetical protein
MRLPRMDPARLTLVREPFVHLNLDEVSVDSVHGGADGFKEHFSVGH